MLFYFCLLIMGEHKILQMEMMEWKREAVLTEQNRYL